MKVRTINNFFKNFFYHKTGKCNICGNYTLFVCTDSINTDRNMVCAFCKSKSRNRMVIKVLLESAESRCKSLKEFSKKSNLKIYNMDTDDVISKYMKKNKNYFSSGYFPKVKLGTEIRERVYSQNVESLSFQSDKFDIVISEHVFEHVRDFNKGFSEIFRVLKIGGRHIFTIPFYHDRETVVRVDTKTENDIFLLPKEYHGDHHSESKKILVYRKFGVDLFGKLKKIGFSTEIIFSKYSDYKKNGIIGSFVFISEKIKKS